MVAADPQPLPSTSVLPPGGPAMSVGPEPSSMVGPADETLNELIRVFVAEAGWRSPRSHAALAHVLKRYAARNGVSLIDAADVLVWKHSNAQVDRPFIRYLDASCAKPDGYPKDWNKRKADCRAVARRARAFLRGDLRDPCARVRPSGWRSPKSKALRRALRKGNERVRCVDGTALAFVKERA